MSIKLDSDLLETAAEKKAATDDAWTLPFNAISDNNDNVLVLTTPPPESKHQFTYNDLTVHLNVASTGDGATCRMWAPVCIMPFTAESPTSRGYILEILQAARDLDGVKFVVEKDQRILALYENTLEGDCTLDLLCLEIIDYLQRALPFTALLRTYAPTK